LFAAGAKFPASACMDFRLRGNDEVASVQCKIIAL
jgi:hypothetical protein